MKPCVWSLDGAKDFLDDNREAVLASLSEDDLEFIVREHWPNLKRIRAEIVSERKVKADEDIY
jgi:hypothetical protein